MRTFFNLYFFGILISTLLSGSQVIGTIDKVVGKVIIKSDYSIKTSVAPILGGLVYIGDRISTADDGELRISLEDGPNLLTIYSESELRLNRSKSSIDFLLDYGSILIETDSELSLNHNLLTENSIISLIEGECFVNRDFSNKDQIYTLRGNVNIKSLKNGLGTTLGIGEFITSDSDSLHNKEKIKEGVLPSKIYNQYKYNVDLINMPPIFTVMNYFSSEFLVDKVKKKQKINYIFNIENLAVQNENYLKFSFFPFYKSENIYNKFIFGYDFSGFLGSSDTVKNLNKFSDLSYLLAPLIFKYHSKEVGTKIEIGKINDLSFGYGSLINNYTNSIYPPSKQDAGLSSVIYSKSGRNKIQIFLSSFVEAASGSALSGVYNERRVGDKGLLLGVGLVVDPNQFKGALDSLWGEGIDPYKRMITGLTFNFTYQIKSSLRNDTYVFGEATSLFYGDKLRYIRSEMIDGKTIQQGYERNSSFGFKGPGIWWKIGHHKSLRIAFNYSSALHATPFFGKTYSLERGHYILSSELDSLEKNEPYSTDEEWNNMIKSNFITLDSSLYYLPKDIYMLLDATNNVHNKMGLSFEYSQSYRNYFNFKCNFDSYKEVESIQSPETYYNLGIELAINNGLLKRVSNFRVYYNQYFSSDFLETLKYSENMIMGANLEIDIIKNISLKIYRHDVFYDSNIDGEVDLNSTMGLGLVVKY